VRCSPSGGDRRAGAARRGRADGPWNRTLRLFVKWLADLCPRLGHRGRRGTGSCLDRSEGRRGTAETPTRPVRNTSRVAGRPARLTKPEKETTHIPESWSPDGKVFLFSVTKDSKRSLWMFSLAEKKVAPFGAVQSQQPINPTFSPDGHWVAYSSSEASDGQTQ